MPACRSVSTQSAAIAMLGAFVSRSMRLRRGLFARGALGIAVEAPRVAFDRDAPPRAPLLRGTHLRPVLDFGEGAATTLALRIALARRADRETRQNRRRVV